MPARHDERPPLISAQALLTLLQERSPAADLLLLDCRFNLADSSSGELIHAQGHLPGAVYAHLDRDLSGPRVNSSAGPHRPGTFDGGRHPLPSPEALQASLQRWGVSPHTRVVAYDDSGGVFAARAWWLLRWARHARVQVLDGGWRAWQAINGPVETAPPHRQVSALAVHSTPAQLASTAEVMSQVAHLAGDGPPDAARAPAPFQLLDARAPDRFRGDNETLDPVGGHIPGALNRFFQLNLEPDGHFKAAATLREEFEALLPGWAPSEVVHYCGSGVTACHNLLAMEAAGLHGSRLYAGSWSAWCADPSRPVAH